MKNLFCSCHSASLEALRERRLVFDVPGESGPVKSETQPKGAEKKESPAEKEAREQKEAEALTQARAKYVEKRTEAFRKLERGLNSPIPGIAEYARKEIQQLNTLDPYHLGIDQIKAHQEAVKKILETYASYLKVEVTRTVVKKNAENLANSYQNNLRTVKERLLQTHPDLQNGPLGKEIEANFNRAKEKIEGDIARSVEAMIAVYLKMTPDQLTTQLADDMDRQLNEIAASVQPGDTKTTLANDLDLAISDFEQESRDAIINFYKKDTNEARQYVAREVATIRGRLNVGANRRTWQLDRNLEDLGKLTQDELNALDQAPSSRGQKVDVAAQCAAILSKFRGKLDELTVSIRANRYTSKDASLKDFNPINLPASSQNII